MPVGRCTSAVPRWNGIAWPRGIVRRRGYGGGGPYARNARGERFVGGGTAARRGGRAALLAALAAVALEGAAVSAGH